MSSKMKLEESGTSLTDGIYHPQKAKVRVRPLLKDTL